MNNVWPVNLLRAARVVTQPKNFQILEFLKVKDFTEVCNAVLAQIEFLDLGAVGEVGQGLDLVD